MLPATDWVRSVKYVSFLVHLIIFSQLHVFIEHKQNDVRHGKISDGNTYTVIGPEESEGKTSKSKIQTVSFHITKYVSGMPKCQI
jgi:hypothetical protein